MLECHCAQSLLELNFSWAERVILPDAKIQDLARFNEHMERVHKFLDRGGPVPPVHVKKARVELVCYVAMVTKGDMKLTQCSRSEASSASPAQTCASTFYGFQGS